MYFLCKVGKIRADELLHVRRSLAHVSTCTIIHQQYYRRIQKNHGRNTFYYSRYQYETQAQH